MAKKKDTKSETKQLFACYGEFDSVEELNAKAAELKSNTEELEKLAQENGLDTDWVQMYRDGYVDKLCPDAMTCAHGKLDVEVSALSGENAELGNGIAEYLKQQAAEDEKIARAIRKKGKCLSNLCETIWREAQQRRKNKSSCVYIPPFEVFQMARAYYLEDKK